MLQRHLLAYRAAGVRDVVLVRFPDDEGLEGLAAGLLVDDVRLSVASADEPDSAGPSDLTIEQRADTWVDPRLVARVTRLSASGVASADLVDVTDGHDSAARSPHRVGTPGDEDLSEASDPALEYFRLGLGLRGGDRSKAPVRLRVGRYLWHRVGGVRDLDEVRRKIFFATMKPTDGIYARTNRRVSIPISTALAPTRVTPNMVTLLVLLCSAVSGLFFAGGGYWNAVAGGVLSWVASMLDGVDGELARAKFQATPFGRWLEMICDYLYYVFIVSGMGVGLYQETANPVWLQIGAGSVVGVVLTFVAVARWRTRHTEAIKDRDPGFAFQQTVGSRPANPAYSFLRRFIFLTTRAALPYYIFGFAVLDSIGPLLAFVCLGANLAWMLVLYALRIPVAAGGGEGPTGAGTSAPAPALDVSPGES